MKERIIDVNKQCQFQIELLRKKGTYCQDCSPVHSPRSTLPLAVSKVSRFFKLGTLTSPKPTIIAILIRLYQNQLFVCSRVLSVREVNFLAKSIILCISKTTVINMLKVKCSDKSIISVNVKHEIYLVEENLESLSIESSMQ